MRNLTSPTHVPEVTQILQAINQGDPDAADRLMSLVYTELKRLAGAKMARERQAHTLQATALVHEAWLRLAGVNPPQWANRRHFFATASEAMRRILIDRARRRKVLQKGGFAKREDCVESRLEQIGPDERILAVHEALDRLEAEDPAAAQAVKLRYFVGMSVAETAEAMEISHRQAERLWTFAKAWLRHEIGGSK